MRQAQLVASPSCHSSQLQQVTLEGMELRRISRKMPPRKQNWQLLDSRCDNFMLH